MIFRNPMKLTVLGAIVLLGGVIALKCSRGGSTRGAADTKGAADTAGTASSNGFVSGTCDTCEFNDSAPPRSFCAGTTVSGKTTTVSAFGCNSLTLSRDITNCQNLVKCLRSTVCQTAIRSATPDYQESGSNFDDPRPCLCGNVPITDCLSATTWTGPCAAQYVAAANGGSAVNSFGNTALPIGIANNLMTCDVDSTVAANQIQNCGTVCGLNTATPQ